MSLEKSLLEVIRASLPEQTAGELKSYITKAEKNSEQLATVLEKNAKLEEQLASTKEKSQKVVDDLNKQLMSQWRLTELKDQIEASQKALDAAILKLDLTLAEKEITMLREQAANFDNLMQTIFRNPTVSTNQTRLFSYHTQYNPVSHQHETVQVDNGQLTTTTTSK